MCRVLISLCLAIVILLPEQVAQGSAVDGRPGHDLVLGYHPGGGFGEVDVEGECRRSEAAQDRDDVRVLVACPVLVTPLGLDALIIDVDGTQSRIHGLLTEQIVAHVQAPVVTEQLCALQHFGEAQGEDHQRDQRHHEDRGADQIAADHRHQQQPQQSPVRQPCADSLPAVVIGRVHTLLLFVILI